MYGTEYSKYLRIESRRFRVYLELLQPADASDIFRYSNQWEIHEFMPWGPQASPEEVRSFIIESATRTELDVGLDYGIRSKADKHMLGVVSLADISRRHRKAELGYWLGREHWGQGLMYEAQVLLLRHAFGPMDLNRIQAKISPRNQKSRSSILRLGFTLEGVLREESYWKGAYHTHELYSLLAGDSQPLMPWENH